MAHLQPRLATGPPELQTKLDMNPTLIVSWFCTIFSLVVILIRIIGRWVRTERLFIEDKVMLYSIIPLMIRMAFVHPVLIYGTNNTETTGLTKQDIRHRELGSRMVLGSRIFYAVYIWVAKAAVLEFVRRIIGTSWTRYYERGARIIYSFLGLTLLAVVVATLVECRPFANKWQVVPDPGPQCRSGSAQLITMGTCDMVTDLVLVLFPIPLVMMSKMPLTKKISLACLFLLSLILIAITGYRMPTTIHRGYSQQYRSLLASLEILAATCVANVIVIGSFLRDKGVKKVKYRAGSVGEDEYEGSVLSRPATHQTKTSVAQRHWGSDEDLVRDLGLTVSADLRHASSTNQSARLAPTAGPVQTRFTDIESPEPTIAPQGRGLTDPAWTFRKGSKQVTRGRRDSDASTTSSSSADFKLQTLQPYTDEEPSSPCAIPETPYKKMNFFDVGGLVDLPPSEESSLDHSRRLSPLQSSGIVSRSGQNFLTDIGGLLNRDRMDEISPAPSNNSRFKPSNLLSPGQTTRERSRPPSSRREGGEETSRPSCSTTVPIPRDADGPDSLNISDAGGLLR